MNQNKEYKENQSKNIFATLKKNYISIGTDINGFYISGCKSDFNYIKDSAKIEFSINIEYKSSSLQADDSIRHYFYILNNK